MSPAVTLAIPTRGDRPDYLDQCLSSIRDQDATVRLILVTDDEEAAERLRMDAQGAEIWVQPGHGAASAIDYVLQRATTPYCAWLGDDDLLLPGSLLETVSVLEAEEDATAAFGRCEVIDASGKSVGSIPTGKWAPAFSRFGRDLIPQPGSLFRTESYRAVGGLDLELKYAFDLDLFLKLAKAGKLAFSPRVLAQFRWHDMSLTATNPAPAAEGRMVRRRHLPPLLSITEHVWFPALAVISRGIYALNSVRRGAT